MKTITRPSFGLWNSWANLFTEKLEIWFPDPQRCLVGCLISQEKCETLKSLSKLEFLCTLTVHGIDKLSIFEQALSPSRPIISTAELNRSLDRPFPNVDAGRPHLLQSYPRWRLIYDTRDVLRFRLSLNQSMKVDRFSILPPEIRTCIYEHYFQSWIGPIQQPVTCFECYERFPVFYPNYRYYLLAPLAKAEAQCADY